MTTSRSAARGLQWACVAVGLLTAAWAVSAQSPGRVVTLPALTSGHYESSPTFSLSGDEVYFMRASSVLILESGCGLRGPQRDLQLDLGPTRNRK